MRAAPSGAGRAGVLQSRPAIPPGPDRSDPMLRAFTAGALLAFGLAAGPALAETTAQQQKMSTCNKEAGDMKGDERKKFMSECLSAKPMSQQDKMKQCNVDATGKTGDERKKFMSECLSSKK
jgi:hypothetical protein